MHLSGAAALSTLGGGKGGKAPAVAPAAAKGKPGAAAVAPAAVTKQQEEEALRAVQVGVCDPGSNRADFMVLLPCGGSCHLAAGGGAEGGAGGPSRGSVIRYQIAQSSWF